MGPGPIILDLPRIEAIAAAFQRSSDVISQEASKMRAQVSDLHEAVQGAPRLTVADDIMNLNRLLGQVSDELAQSNAYLKDVVAKARDFVEALGR